MQTWVEPISFTQEFFLCDLRTHFDDTLIELAFKVEITRQRAGSYTDHCKARLWPNFNMVNHWQVYDRDFKCGGAYSMSKLKREFFDLIIFYDV